jgi:hypothetical protein
MTFNPPLKHMERVRYYTASLRDGRRSHSDGQITGVRQRGERTEINIMGISYWINANRIVYRYDFNQ